MRITTRTINLLGAAVLAGALLAGCGGDDSDTESASSAGGAPMAEPAAPAEGKDQAAEAPDLSVDQRSIVYTGSITVRVDDVNAAAARAAGLATAAGGFVGEDKRNSGTGSDDAQLTLRVPAEKFTDVVNQLAALGEEENRGISTEDVTEQTIDLDARIAVQQARVDSGRRLLAEADSLNDLVMLEKEVATRESDLASLQAKKRRLADLTALSTITVVLLDPDAAAASGPDGPPGFLAGLAGGWHALLASMAVLVTVLGALLPWLIALGLPAWAVIWAYRRFARRRPALVAPAFAGPLPTHSGPFHPGAPQPGTMPAHPGGPQPGTMPHPGTTHAHPGTPQASAMPAHRTATPDHANPAHAEQRDAAGTRRGDQPAAEPAGDAAPPAEPPSATSPDTPGTGGSSRPSSASEPPDRPAGE